MMFLSLVLALTLVIPSLFSVSAAPTETNLLRRAPPLAKVIKKCYVNGTVALTFDDGPTEYVDQILAILSKHKAKGTFFVNGNNQGCIYDQATNVPRVQKIYNAGHQVGSHTWSHPDLVNATRDQMHNQMYLMEVALSEIIGVVPKHLRPPYGSRNDLVREVAATAARQQDLVIWDYDASDAFHPEGKTSQEDVIKRWRDFIATKPGAILPLMHEKPFTAAVLDDIIPRLKALKYKLVTVAECVNAPAYRAPRSTSWKPTPKASWTCDKKPKPGKP